MARIDKRRTGRTRTHAAGVKPGVKPKPAPATRRSGGSIEDTMFFPRLRRHTKWAFVLLALVFGVGFVVFGVGATGTGVGDLFRNGNGGSGGPTLKSATKATQERPNDPKAWDELAQVYRTEGNTDGAISAQSRYTELAPKDADGFRTLSSDYFAQANEQAQIAQNAQVQTAYSGSVSPAGEGPTLNGKPLFTDSLANVSPSTSSAYDAAVQAQSTALQNAVAAYKKVAALAPNDPNVQYELGNTAVQAGDATTAIAAFKRYLKLAPDSSDAPLVRQQLKQLQKSSG
jgi:hypothetical protein